MTNMDAKLDIWKNKLLDLGKRNKLLNFRDTRKSSLRIIKPEIFTLWDDFVLKEQPLIFPLWEKEPEESEPEEKESEELESDEKDLEELEAENKKEEAEKELEDVITNHSVTELQSVLRNIRGKARTFMEEQGVNILYLSFGFLRWAEKSDSKQQFDAPLILVPVTLNWESITSPFILCLHEDEIVVNPTLIYKLEHDFGIKLPEFDVDKEDIKTYFNKIENIVRKNNWNVIPDTRLGILSFLKINMYRDLEGHREEILCNPIIRTIAGDPSAMIQDLSKINDYDHDKNTTPEQIFQVVDADSSQQDAILCAKKGISFVLQGPPGTGKSQTITNIISECLAEGKKILFVSEKMAALDVVYRRLEEADLSDFCLILHSHKANKRATMEQLRTVLNLAGKKVILSEEAFQKLDRLTDDRRKLNDYAESVFTVIEPLHKTIYEANGMLASLSGYEDVIFSVPEIHRTTQQNYQEYISCLQRFSESIGQMSGDYRDNPWRGTVIKYVNHEFRHNLGANLTKLLENCGKLSKIHEEIFQEISYIFKNTFNDLAETVGILHEAAKSYRVPAFWVLEERTQEISKEIDWHDKYRTCYIFLKNRILELYEKIKELDREVNLSENGSLLTSVEIYGHQLALDNMISQRACYNTWNKKDSMEQAEALYEEFKNMAEEYGCLQKDIENSFEREIFQIDYNSIYLRFKSDYTSVWKIFKIQYHRDKKEYSRFVP